MLSSIIVMDTVNYLFDEGYLHRDGGFDAHANTKRGSILRQKARRWLAPESSANTKRILFLPVCP